MEGHTEVTPTPLTPRTDQLAAIEAIFTFLSKGNPVAALPGGTGKSLIIAELVIRLFKEWSQVRILIATHTKELVKQDADELKRQWPTAPYGILSAGLNKADTALPIIFCNIQSAVHRMEQLGGRDILIIDEAHLLSPKAETQYAKLIAHFRTKRSWFRVCGFSATPYRLKQGYITEDGLFDEIVYDSTGFSMFNDYIRQGILCPLFPRPTRTRLDVTNVGMLGGDFHLGELEQACDTDRITWDACKEIVDALQEYPTCLIYGTGVNHVKHITECLQVMNIDARALTQGSTDRDELVNGFKANEFPVLVNHNILTTGFNKPDLMMIGNLRPTNSTSLWVQMLSRLTRMYPGKRGGLVLDFAYNTERLGPINDPNPPRPPGKGNAPRVPPIRICPQCNTYNHASARECCQCGLEFSRETTLFPTASTTPVLRTEEQVIQRWSVSRVVYLRHMKTNSMPMMRVSYLCDLGIIDEYVTLEHGGYAAKRSRDWWRSRTGEEPPPNTEQALVLSARLRVPIALDVWTNKRYPEIMRHYY